MADEPDFLNRVEVGGSVFWGRSGSDSPLDVTEGEVVSADDRSVTARAVREWRATPDGWDGRPAPDGEVRRIARADLDRLLPARLEQTKRFWRGVVGSFADMPEAHAEMVRLGRKFRKSGRALANDPPAEAAP